MTTEQLKALVRDVPDFPEVGIIFKDLMPLIGNAAAFHSTVEHLAEWTRPRNPDVILGAEARGFIFGGALAYELGCGFVPARKPGKLPWETVRETYDLEYGTDSLEVHADAFPTGARVIVLDDVLATGGTARAKVDLVGAARRRGRGRALRHRADLPGRQGASRRHRRARADRVLILDARLDAVRWVEYTVSMGDVDALTGRYPALVPGDRHVRRAALRVP